MRLHPLFSGFLCALVLAACAPSTGNETPPQSPGMPQGWKQYRDEIGGFSFYYPPKQLSLTTDGQHLVLKHEVPYNHPDPCDFKGDAKWLSTLTDFNVTMEMAEKTLRDAVIENEGSDYVATQFMQGNDFTMGEGSPVEKVRYGDLDGHRITSGVEGCGRYVHYFASPTGRTFVVHRLFIPEFGPINSEADKARALPGVLEPEDETLLFERMMSTVRFEGGTTSSVVQ